MKYKDILSRENQKYFTKLHKTCYNRLHKFIFFYDSWSRTF